MNVVNNNGSIILNLDHFVFSALDVCGLYESITQPDDTISINFGRQKNTNETGGNCVVMGYFGTSCGTRENILKKCYTIDDVIQLIIKELEEAENKGLIDKIYRLAHLEDSNKTRVLRCEPAAFFFIYQKQLERILHLSQHAEKTIELRDKTNKYM